MVLDCIWSHRSDGVRVVDLMRLCDLERAATYRFLATLISTGYVARRDRFRYVPGPRLEGLPLIVPADDVSSRLQPVLQRISQLTQDTSFAIVRDGSQAHCIAREIGTYPVQVLTRQVGDRVPLGVGSAGLALLAALPKHEAAATIAANRTALGRFHAMSTERLSSLMKSTRERGWAIVGTVPGTLAIGLTVPAPGGTPIAAISVAAPLERMTAKGRQNFVVTTIRETLAKLRPKGVS